MSDEGRTTHTEAVMFDPHTEKLVFLRYLGARLQIKGARRMNRGQLIPLIEARIAGLADEAEAGYDVSKMGPSRPLPRRSP